jgi:hypothetical protein
VTLRSRLRLVVAVVAAAAIGAAVAGAYVLGSSGKSGAEQVYGGPAPMVEEAGDQPAWPDCQSISGRCAFITDVSVRDGHYEAWYEVHGFDPVRPENGGGADDHHLHFFFDTTSPQQTGDNQASAGAWSSWDRQDGDGDLVFDDVTPAQARQLGAERLCVLVADTGGAVELGTGNCVDLPD